MNETVLAHSATLGNVEAELQGDSGAGCGCAIPQGWTTPPWSAQTSIMARLRETAARFPDLIARLASLPKVRTFEIGGMRVGILHGDPESLAGWGLAREALAPELTECAPAVTTPESVVARWFTEANVRVYLSSHTCLPVMKALTVHRTTLPRGQQRCGRNAQFPGQSLGSDHARVDARRQDQRGRFCGSRIGTLHVDAVPLHYNHPQWSNAFLPTGRRFTRSSGLP